MENNNFDLLEQTKALNYVNELKDKYHNQPIGPGDIKLLREKYGLSNEWDMPTLTFDLFKLISGGHFFCTYKCDLLNEFHIRPTMIHLSEKREIMQRSKAAKENYMLAKKREDEYNNQMEKQRELNKAAILKDRRLEQKRLRPLKQYLDKDLVNELKRRGYRGHLEYKIIKGLFTL